jgi:hypothetical protein
LANENQQEDRPPKVTVVRRLEREGRWHGPDGAKGVRDRLMREARQRGLDKAQAQAEVYIELDKMFPPLPQDESGRVQGLGQIPADWPELPDNASLQAEIGWVQAQRLRIVEEMPTGAIRVHLDRARSPAPSWAALGWLETSIRSYAKYVDVAARATASQEDQAEAVRRERMQIEDIRALLREMRNSDG